MIVIELLYDRLLMLANNFKMRMGGLEILACANIKSGAMRGRRLMIFVYQEVLLDSSLLDMTL